LTIAEARRLFSPETTYLNAASYGLPPRPAVEALLGAVDEWRHGRTHWAKWDRAVGESREVWGGLHGAAGRDVAVAGQVSAFTGLIALSLERGARVVTVERDFTSVIWPFLVRDARVDLVPLEQVADAIDGSTALVAVSAVQSLDGRVADLDAITAAAEHHGALTCVDATQASGWLPLDAGRFDFLMASAYKWLLSPRGSSFMTARPAAAERLRPHMAGWYAGDDPFETNYDAPLRLADDASRFDLSPAWMSWVGAVPALRLLAEVGIDAIHAHDVGLANRFRAGLGLDAGDSAIVALPAQDYLVARLQAADVSVTVREGFIRFSFHIFNDEADVDRALEAAVGRTSGM
jgi:selenocysteine lyase/cysteine desulfurase